MVSKLVYWEKFSEDVYHFAEGIDVKHIRNMDMDSNCSTALVDPKDAKVNTLRPEGLENIQCHLLGADPYF